MVIILRHATVYTPRIKLEDASIWIENGRINRVGAFSEIQPAPFQATERDLSGLSIVPGLIDLQLNGAFGDDFTAQPDSIWRVAAQLPRFGITSFLPTIVTSPVEQIELAQHVLQARPSGFHGSHPLGLHLEGPFLNPQKRGAHNPDYLRTPDVGMVADWSPTTNVRLVTLAPELPNALAVTERLISQNVLVSMGHTMATLEQAEEGFAAGIRYATHLFNAMPPLDHRAPGAAGAVLTNPDWVTGLIVDGIHVHPAVVRMVWFAKGAAGLNLVSDAMAALGKAPGLFRLNDMDVFVSDREARLGNGTLAGCVVALDQNLRGLLDYAGCSLADALASVTTTPARLLNVAAERGQIAEGMVADLVVLNEALEVVMTIAGGEIVFEKGV